jgi:hypothetical protein
MLTSQDMQPDMKHVSRQAGRQAGQLVLHKVAFPHLLASSSCARDANRAIGSLVPATLLPGLPCCCCCWPAAAAATVPGCRSCSNSLQCPAKDTSFSRWLLRSCSCASSMSLSSCHSLLRLLLVPELGCLKTALLP